MNKQEKKELNTVISSHVRILLQFRDEKLRYSILSFLAYSCLPLNGSG